MQSPQNELSGHLYDPLSIEQMALPGTRTRPFLLHNRTACMISNVAFICCIPPALGGHLTECVCCWPEIFVGCGAQPRQKLKFG